MQKGALLLLRFYLSWTVGTFFLYMHAPGQALQMLDSSTMLFLDSSQTVNLLLTAANSLLSYLCTYIFLKTDSLQSQGFYMCAFPSVHTERGKIVFPYSAPSERNNLHKVLKRRELISLNFKSILKWIYWTITANSLTQCGRGLGFKGTGVLVVCPVRTKWPRRETQPHSNSIREEYS